MGLFDKIMGRTEGEPQTVNDQTKEERDLVAFVKNRVEEARMAPARIAQEGIWMTNIAYLLGYDGIYYDPMTRMYKPANTKSPYLKRNRVFVNKILPTVQNRLARLCKSPPKYDVRPNSMDSSEKDNARFKLQVLTMLWDKQRLNKKRIPLYMWMQQCGHAYIKVSFDPELGEMMLDPESNEMQYEGDIRSDVISSFEVFADPMAKALDDAAWVVHAKVRKLDYFRAQYPERGNLVKEEGAWLLSAQYEQRINALNNMNGAQGSAQMQMKHSAIECAYYEKRSNKHPNGRLVIIANGVLLADKELPVGEIPFAKFDDIVIGGKYCSESIITHIRPIQDEYNRTISARRAFTNRLLAGKYIAAKGHGLTKEALNDQSGEIVEYTPVPNASDPKALEAPTIPAYAYQEEEKLQSMLYDISGINEVSRGQMPSADMPAIGMQLLTEQDDTRIGIMTECHEESWARVGKLELLYAQKFFKTPRLLKIAGKNQEYTIREFTGDDLQGDPDVIVVRGSTLPGNKALRRQEIINTWQQGLLGNPQDPKVRENVLGMLEFGDVAEMWEDFSLDQAQSKRVIESIEQNIMPEVSEFDNNVLILQELNRYRKSEKFTLLDTERQALLMQQIEARVQLLTGQADPRVAAANAGIDAPETAVPPMPPPTGPLPESPDAQPPPMPPGPGPTAPQPQEAA